MITRYEETKVFLVTDVIPEHTLLEFGEKEMMKEFYSLIINHFYGSKVNGWSVTLTCRTDEPESESRAMLRAGLEEIPALAINAFT